MKHPLMQIFKKSFVLAAGAMLATAVTAQSQVVKQFPANLQWETMSLVGFNFDYPGYEGTPAERKLAWLIWGPTIDAFPRRDDGKKWAAFVILNAFENNSHRYVFSSMGAASVVYPQCEDAINSKNPNTPIYTYCDLRVAVQNKATGKAVYQDYPRFCHIASNDKDQPKSRNYEQVAISQDGKTAYFRVVQYGKPAPECNRSITLN